MPTPPGDDTPAPAEQPAASSTRAGGSTVGGSLSLESSSFVGRDSITGLDGEGVSKIIEVLLKYFPQTYLQQPEQLEKVLDDFQHCHEELYEWKELHNYLDTTIQMFDQFWDAVNTANSKNFNLGTLKNGWFKIAMVLDELLAWAGQIKIIGQKYVVDAGGRLSGENWAIKLELARRDLDQHLESAQKALEAHERSSLFSKLLSTPQINEYWFAKLVEFASNYRALALGNMHFADDHLRATATRLVDISQKALQAVNKD